MYGWFDGCVLKKKRNNLFLNSDLYYTSLYFIHTFMISSTIQHSIDIYLRHIAGYIKIIKKKVSLVKVII